jgi:2,3-bisphosphoglycerate-dependent phosphoglycerate mutase
LHYKLNAQLKPIAPGEYLDPTAAASAIKAVANQGKN